MKAVILTLLLGISLLGCKRDSWSDPNVDQFVIMLEKGTYNSMFLPDFKPADIERLLYHARDFRTIKSFPINPISSYRPLKFRLGECLLWTVESIRLKYDTSDEFQKFPSLAPELFIPGGTIEPRVASIDDLNRAYNLYLSWWTDNKSRAFSDFRDVNPLKDAVLMWR